MVSREHEARVVVVISPKGGVGKTTVATHLAVALCSRIDVPTVLLDLDVAFGDVTSALLLAPRLDIVHAADALRIEDLQRFTATLAHHPSGLDVLGAPNRLVPDPNQLAEDVELVLEELTDRYGNVVCDTGAGLDRVTLAAIKRATDLVVVASLDVPTLLSLQKALRWLQDSDILPERTHVVLNRSVRDAAIELEDVEATIGMPVNVVIPVGDDVVRATNEGRPLTTGPIGDAFAELADRVVPPAADREAWLDFWRSRAPSH